ncbi:hypothetical protein [Ornithinibacillus salinisoli]
MTITILLFFSVMGLFVDVIAGVDYPFNFYQIMDSLKLELFDVLVYAVNYSIYGYFFSYFILKWEMKRINLLLFIIIWSGITTLIEWISIKFHVFTYMNGWNIGFSSIAYMFIFTISALFIKLFSYLWGNVRSESMCLKGAHDENL